MRLAGALALLGVCGCSADPTTLRVTVSERANDRAPTSLAITVFDRHGTIGSKSVPSQLPGAFLVELPSLSQALRVAVLGMNGPAILVRGATSAMVTAGQESDAAIVLSAASLDSDGDGVPDSIDDCPQAPNADQRDRLGNGVGDACRPGDGGGCPGCDLALRDAGPRDGPIADLALPDDLSPPLDATVLPDLNPGDLRIQDDGGLAGDALCGFSATARMTVAPGPEWVLNGAATWDGNALSLVLTPSGVFSNAGTMIYDAPLDTRAGFDATFDFRITADTPGMPADGISFFLITDGSHSIGGIGGGLGSSGLNGWSVELDTYDNDDCGDVDGNHVGISSLVFCDATTPTGLTATPATLNLADAAWHTAAIHFAPGGVVSLLLDGAPQIMQYAIPGFADRLFYLGLGAGTGGLISRQEVRNVMLAFPACM